MEQINELDVSILRLIHQYLRHPISDRIFIFITHLGDYGFIWLAFAAILLLRRQRSPAIRIVINLALVYLFAGVLLKHLIQRPRPFQSYPLYFSIPISLPSSWSFPSGHSASSFCAAHTIQQLFGRRAGLPAYILAVLIAFSRLLLGVHYPSDVLTGMLIGILFSFILSRIIKCLPTHIPKVSQKQS